MRQIPKHHWPTRKLIEPKSVAEAEARVIRAAIRFVRADRAFTAKLETHARRHVKALLAKRKEPQ